MSARQANGPRSRRFRDRRARGGDGGFSLLEVLFALTFLAVGILAVASMIPAGTRGVSQSRILTSGLMMGQRKIVIAELETA